MRILGVPQLVPSQYSCCHLIALELSLNEVCYRLAHNGPRTRNESNSFAIALHAMFRRFISSSLALLFFNGAHTIKETPRLQMRCMQYLDGWRPPWLEEELRRVSQSHVMICSSSSSAYRWNARLLCATSLIYHQECNRRTEKV